MSEGLLVAAPLGVEVALIASTMHGAGVRKTGMGPERARAAAGTLAHAPGRALLVLGFCGGLDAESVPGEVIVAESVVAASDEGHAPGRVACVDSAGLVRTLRGRGMTVRSGEIVCVSKPALGERRAQLLAGGALAVDMESVWLAAGAAQRPFAVVRVVLDSPSHELRRPQAVAGALRAARALRRVAATLREWTPSPQAPRGAGRTAISPDGPGSAELYGGPPEG
jgi:4-hydroxy-3-methylbut-2-en-1-yl diphosphate reductase